MNPENIEWLINGKRGLLDPGDRGLAYGDGLFETMAANSGSIRWIDHHLERLSAGCRQLRFAEPDPSILRDEIEAACPASGKAVIKLIVTRGAGNRGYRPPQTPVPTRIVGALPWPARPVSNYSSGIDLKLCELRLAENETLAGLKHLNRLEQVLASAELENGDAEEGLLLGRRGQVIGGTFSNLFVLKRGRLLTPRLDRCGVKGVMRRIVLEIAPELGLEPVEAELGLGDLTEADSLFVTNAVFGIWPVRRFQQRSYAIEDSVRSLQSSLGYTGDA